MGMVRTVVANDLVRNAMLSHIPNANSEDYSEVKELSCEFILGSELSIIFRNILDH